MGPEVLRPHHCLHPAPALFPRRKPFRRNPSAEPSPTPVRILKRGEPLKPEKTRAPAPAAEAGRRTRPLPFRVGPPTAEVYAGTAFALSPSPRALPLPRFTTKKSEAVDSSATQGLRRLLRLD